MNTEAQTESEIQALGLNAPRVTPAMVDAAIKEADYTLLPDGRSTICTLTLDNGFTVRGESSCVSRENYNADIGNKIAFDDARKKVWPLLAFRLADYVHSASKLKVLPGSSRDTEVFAEHLGKALASAQLPAPTEPRLPIDIGAATGPALGTKTFDSVTGAVG